MEKNQFRALKLSNTKLFVLKLFVDNYYQSKYKIEI